MSGVLVSPRREAEGSSRVGADCGAIPRAKGGAGRFKFVRSDNPRSGMRRAGPDHSDHREQTKIQIENHQFSMPDVVD